MADPIFEALTFRNLTVKNRIFRSNVSGRFDNYDGSGTQARHQLGGEVCPGRGRGHHLILRPGDDPRSDHPQLRDDRHRRAHPVLAEAREGGPPSRLQVHPAAESCWSPA